MNLQQGSEVELEVIVGILSPPILRKRHLRGFNFVVSEQKQLQYDASKRNSKRSPHVFQ